MIPTKICLKRESKPIVAKMNIATASTKPIYVNNQLKMYKISATWNSFLIK